MTVTDQWRVDSPGAELLLLAELGRWANIACCNGEKFTNSRDRPEPTRSRLSKHRSGPEHCAFNPNPFARVMLFDSRKCILNCRRVGIRKRIGETSDIAALQLL